MQVASVINLGDRPAERLLVGKSRAIGHLRQLVRRVAQSSASVMVTGPSGAGKEVIARAIHAESPRANGPFVAINCGAIPPDLIESELFGHERGSFTGAHARRIGRFEEAHRGTLFLDEIGDMRFDMQVKLLRVLEDRLVTRIGGGAAIPVDVRIVTATHQDMERAIAENRFRQDLYFRLGVVPIAVPALAERVEDLPLLIDHFQRGVEPAARARFAAPAIARLEQHGWAGNVRELRNIVERANVLHGGSLIGPGEVEQLLGFARPNFTPGGEIIPLPLPPAANDQPAAADGREPIDLKALLETLELERIQMALDMADGVVTEAARLLTLKRTTLIEKMRKYALDR